MFAFPNIALDDLTKAREMLVREKSVLTYLKLISIC